MSQVSEGRGVYKVSWKVETPPEKRPEEMASTLVRGGGGTEHKDK